MGKRDIPSSGSNRVVRAVADRQTWLEVAKETLIQEGIDAVKIDRLASTLNISRSSFYWQFKNRRELLDALLQYWAELNDSALRNALEHPPTVEETSEAVARARLVQLANLFINGHEFSAKFELSVRDWSRRDAKVAKVVATVDSERLRLFQRIFLDLGESDVDSLIRARILYLHQLGYYLVGIEESADFRNLAAPRYLEILSGLPFPAFRT
jgi:AcrR family transcriptional regulator